MPLLLGVDIGTTGTKTILADHNGRILSTAYEGYKTYREKLNYAEQNPEDWWNAVVNTVKSCIEGLNCKNEIKALSLSTQGGSLVPVDKAGNPLTNAIVWMDTRGEDQCRQLSSGKDKNFYYLKTGWRLSGGLNLVQIKWLMDNKPEIFQRTYKFLSTVEYINYKLTGIFCGDPSNAAMTMMFNVKEKGWDKDILDILGMSDKKLGNIVESGDAIAQLTAESSETLGLPKDVQVVSGGHDQYCVALGTGAINTGDVVLSTGTAWVVTGIADRPLFDTNTYFSPGNHIVKGQWGILASKPAGGAALEWYRNNVGRLISNSEGKTELESLAHIDERALERGPGAGGVLFYPHFTGLTSPLWKLNNRATVIGLDLSHDRYHLARAVMEGVVFDINLILDGMRQNGFKPNSLKVVGGAARSSLWTQIIADITGYTVTIPEFSDIACSGAVILAGVGSGIFKDFEDGCRKMVVNEKEILPDIKNASIYKELSQKHRRILELLTECYL